jgi:hypothetical protein
MEEKIILSGIKCECGRFVDFTEEANKLKKQARQEMIEIIENTIMDKEEMLEEFRDEIYGDDDALFDREGNNVSRQVENWLSKRIDRVRQEERECLGCHTLPEDNPFHTCKTTLTLEGKNITNTLPKKNAKKTVKTKGKTA